MLLLLLSLGVAHAAKDAPPSPSTAEDARWRATVETVSRAVVSIQMDRPRAFEGVGRSNGQATGFVIDKDKGLILTNRHVVTAGPIVARAVFTNQEEVDLVPVYRDPIHDFGIFRYDPAKLKHTDPSELPLRPERAQVGVEIRVVGNDSGEQLSILDGTLARLDRPAPKYGGGYSDYDTFYIQASSSTSGGSSGSPVVDIDGNVLALNAGSKTSAATSFYLPLDRVVPTVEKIRAGQPVSRGTLQTRAEYTAFPELRRLGLTQETEALARDHFASIGRKDGTGMLVFRDVLPKGPADDKIETGDILVEIDGRPVLDFVSLEEILDTHVGKTIGARLERRGKRVDVELEVGDLAAIVPSRLLEVGGAVLHELSIHQARAASVPVAGLYVAESGRMFAPLGEGAVLVELDGQSVAKLDDLERILSDKGDQQPIRARWYALSRPQQITESAVRMDRRWFASRLCSRDDTTGAWPCRALPSAGAAEPARPVPLDVPLPPAKPRRARILQPSLVGVRADVPLPVAGLSKTAFGGAGLVVDAERGLVVVDRDTVPVALADVRLLVAGAFEVPARVVALHEVHNLALVSYDPALLQDIEVRAARFSRRPLGASDRLLYVGLAPDGSVDTREARVSRIEPFGLAGGSVPRFRETNLDVVELQDAVPSNNGALVRASGAVSAFWSAFSYNDGQQTRVTWRAIPADVVEEMLALGSGDSSVRTLGWELGVVSLPRASERGLPPEVAERLVEHDPERRHVLQIDRLEEGDALEGLLRPGDLLVAIDGQPVTRYREVEQHLYGKSRVEVEVVREGGLTKVEILPRPLQTLDLEQVVLWAGLRLHAPDHSARLLGVPDRAPYISWLESGSPAGRAGLRAQRSVTAVDGQPTPDLTTFVRLVLAAQGESVRIDAVTRTGEREVFTVEPDEAFFPTESYTLVGGVWQRQPLR